MVKNVLQCCYTNASRETGNIVTSGWQAVCVSPDLPSDAFSTCTRIQNVNSSIQSTMTDENGNVLNLFEICGDGFFVYVIRTQYGLLDRLGRANMFSHAFIFPCKDSSTILDPNTFLTLANDNFKDNEEGALEYSDELSRIPAFDIDGAMKYCGLDNVRLLALVKSVYTQMSDKKTAKPLYIQYDGTEELLRALLFCIYYSMPLSLRRKLSIASVKTDNTTGKNIIFSKRASEQDLYFDPVTGEGTILTARIERRLMRLKFWDYAISNISHPKIQHYFEALENKTIELGDATSSNELIMKIAHIQLINKDICSIDDLELDVMLSDALRSNSLGNGAMNDYIAMLLSEITYRKLILTDENEYALAERLGVSASTSLLNAAEEYNFYRFNELSTNDAVSKLSKMSEKVFLDYRRKLIISENGRKILDYYYAEVKLRQFGNSWDDIQKIIDETTDMSVKPLTDDKIDECAWRLYCNCLDNLKDNDIKFIVDEYKNYMEVMQRRLDSQKSLECGAVAREAFWEQLSYDDINFSMFYFYKDMETKSQKCHRYLTYCALPSILFSKDEKAFFKAANTFFFDAYEDLKSQYKSIADKVIEEAKKVSPHQNKYFESWCKVMFATYDNFVFENLINLYDCTKSSDVNKILNFFNSFVVSADDAQISFSIKREVAQIVASICKKLDTNRNPVSLDGWLLLGGYLHTNSFYILENINPFILNKDGIDVVSNSKLIRKQKYWDDANNYVRDRGCDYRIVKKWLLALQHLNRVAKDSRKETNKSNQGFISRSVFALSKFTQDEQQQLTAVEKIGRQDDVEKEDTDSIKHAADSKKVADRKEQSTKKKFFSGLFGKK